MTSQRDTSQTELTKSQESVRQLEEELESTSNSLSRVTSELQESRDRVLAMEEDAGVEFRSKIRTLERQLSDATAKVLAHPFFFLCILSNLCFFFRSLV